MTQRRNQPAAQAITQKEQSVLEFIQSYIQKNGISPTYEEIRLKHGLAALSSVQQYLNQLEIKGYLKRLGKPGSQKTRAIEIIKGSAGRGAEGSLNNAAIPLLGRVAAGRPIEASLHDEFVDVTPSMLTPTGEFFALQVKGDSMINDGIMEDDIVIIKKQPTAFNGQTVVALIDNEATIKCFFKKRDHIELHSANPKYKPIIVQSNQNFRIEGILHGLIRKFRR